MHNSAESMLTSSSDAEQERCRRRYWGPVSSFAYLYLALLCLFLFLLSGKFDPDFEAYRVIFESGWGGGMRDPMFSLLVDTLRDVVSYELFRLLMCSVFSVALFSLARKLSAMSSNGRLGLPAVLALTPFVFLKLHVQIREGIALLLWLLAVTNHAGNIARNVRTTPFWTIALISTCFHSSVLIWWVAASFLGFKKLPYVLCLSGFFALLGLATTAKGSEFFVNYAGGIYFVGGEDYVQPTTAKWLYWMLFLAFPIFALLLDKSRVLTTPTRNSMSGDLIPSVFGMIGVYGMLGFFPIALVGVILWGATGTDFNLTIRIAITLMLFLVLQLALTCRKRVLSWLTLIFISLTVFRLLIFPE
jgi:hypothetical protein